MVALPPNNRSCLFVLSGGGMPGLDIHAGILAALADHNFAPTAVAGTSAGALIGALLAAGRSPANIVALLTGLSDRDVRSERLLWKMRLPWLDSFMENAPIRSLLKEWLPPTWEEMRLPYQAWATELLSGASVNVANPTIAACPADAALASMSICGVFPPVALADGLQYVDGGVRRNLPLPHNFTQYDEVFLLIASQRPPDYRKTRGILTHLMRNLQYLMLDQIEDVIEEAMAEPGPIHVSGLAPESCMRRQTRQSVHVLWPQPRVDRGALHFDHSLIAQAATAAASTLDRIGIKTFTPIPLKESP